MDGNMEKLTPETCVICDKPLVQHLFSGEFTCFVHGNPNGSQLEQEIHRTWLVRYNAAPEKQLAIENED
jgi:hypothetical protein